MRKHLIRILFLMAFASGIASTASAQYWFQDGYSWLAWPQDGPAGDCFGNCGAGCSDSVNPCGGPSQYWDLTYSAGPDFYQSGVETVCDANSGLWIVREWREYHAIGIWTYHGWVMPGCITHDQYCNQWLIGCVMFFGCGDPGWTDTWSYTEWMRGFTYTDLGNQGTCSPN